MTRAFLLVVLIVCVSAGMVSAQTQSVTFNYQGKLVGTDGQPVPDGTHSIKFRLYGVETGGTALWLGTYSVQVFGGVFSVAVGPIPTDLFVTNNNCWLALEVDGTALSPRTRLLQVPYAGRAFKADQAIYANDAGHAAQADNATTATNASIAYSVSVGSVGSEGLQPGLYFRGSPAVQGSLYVSEGNGTGGGLIISDAGKFVDLNDNWLTLQAPALRIRNLANTAWAALDSGSHTIYGDATVSGNLTVSGTVTGNISLADNSVTSAKIADGTIQLNDIGANGAAAGQVIKRNSTNTGWVVAADNDTIYMAGNGISISGGSISVAAGGIGAHHMSATGASAGDVLSYDGTSVLWKPSSSSSFSLPYSGSVLSVDSAFSVTNTGVGNAASFGGNVSLTGKLTANSDLRSPIFYDLNNTSYYVDPASTSLVNNLTVSGTLTASSLDSRFLRKDLGSTGVQTFYGDIDLRDASGNSYLHPNATNASNWTCIASQVFNSSNYYGPNSTATIYVGESSNTVNVPGNLRTPILYDLNNTSYYVDPASTSHVNDLRANIIYDRNDTNYYLDPASTSKLNSLEVSDLNVSGSLAVGSVPVRSPIAYGNISSTGTVYSGTGNFICTWNSSSQQYEIAITGESYYYPSYATTVTPSSGPRIPSVSSISGKLVVAIYDLAGNRVQSGFQFVTYKP